MGHCCTPVPGPFLGVRLTRRLVRLLRLVKLGRILRASRILARWQDALGLQYAHMTIMRFMGIIFFSTHWIACLWRPVRHRPATAPPPPAGKGRGVHWGTNNNTSNNTD